VENPRADGGDSAHRTTPAREAGIALICRLECSSGRIFAGVGRWAIDNAGYREGVLVIAGLALPIYMRFSGIG
jgi:hypothetical protein